ncbi:MAG TPA: acyltransferase [Thermomicrobiaceae bacterium]|nr:acyltransferase [Thermomicrobiaceae bacterium]
MTANDTIRAATSIAFRVHPTADVSPTARIGSGAQIWHHVQIRDHAEIGPGCILGKGVYIDAYVRLGANCKIQNYSLLYRGATLGNGVFIGPAVVLTNDRYPRAVTPDGTLKGEADWECGETHIEDGASIGARAVLVTGIRIGRWAMVGAGSVVTRDVRPHALVLGTPARQVGWVCRCGRPLVEGAPCPACGDALDDVRG